MAFSSLFNLQLFVLFWVVIPTEKDVSIFCGEGFVCYPRRSTTRTWPLSSRRWSAPPPIGRDITESWIPWLDLSSDYVMRTKLDPDFSANPQSLLGSRNLVIYKHTMAQRLNMYKQRAGIEPLIRMIEGDKYGLDQKIEIGIAEINDLQIGYSFNTRRAQERAEFINFLKSSMKNKNYDELYRLLKRKLDSIAMEAEIATESYHISPRELVEVITKAATQLQQQVVQQQIEKIEKIQQVIEEEGATILRTKREAEDEKQEEIYFLLMLLVLWFLLCYCSDGTVPWCVDVELTFGLSLALSEIVLLLGGDIEKNPGPLTGEELAKVDSKCLSTDDLGIIYRAISSVAHRWQNLCILLGISQSKVDAIEQTYCGRGYDCLSKGLNEWLQRNYNTDKYGLPSWRTLIEHVDDIDCALARDLVKKHEVADTGPLREGDRCCTCECREFDRSANFSVLFSEITTYLRMDIPDADVNKLKTFLRYFCHPSRGRYVKQEIYRTATSTMDILDALFDDKYISPTNLHLLRCIVKRFGGQKCKETLQQYTDKYPPCTCM